MSLDVHIWSDVACPWCFVGKKRFDAALASSGIDATCHFHSFELDPRPLPSSDPRDYAGRLADKLRVPRDRAISMLEHMTVTGAECGISFHFERAVWANTFDAHRLLQWVKVQSPRQQGPFAQALFEAHFCNGRNLNRSADLLELVEEFELDAASASQVLASEQFGKEVRNDEEEARRRGISGVPFYAIGQYSVRGAERSEVFADVLARATKDAGGALARSEGAACGEDGGC